MTEFLYKFACFDCQVAFKRQAADDTYIKSAHLADSDFVHVCPNCNHRMAFVGRNFETPSRSDNSAWYAAKNLWESGFRFVGSGYHMDPPLPRKKQEVKDFIKKNPDHKQRVGTEIEWSSYV